MSASRSERRRGFVATVKPLALAIAAALSPWNEGLALPTGEQVVAGQVGVSRPNPQNMVVQQGSAKAIVNWQGFSVGSSESVNFQQPGASSVILNRVVGNNASEIYGRLSANGQVFLVNPSGVLFGRTAMVDVGALVASTLSIGNEDFLAGRYRFTGNGKPGLVENQGTLAARDGGFVALLGGQVSNSGMISARLGTAGLAAGNKMTLDFAGDGLVRITVDESALAAEVRNQGAVIADGGQAILSARSAEALTHAVVNQTGLVRARTLTERQGKIVLDGGSTGQTLASGTLDASGPDPGQKGGEIQVLGHHVGVTGKALLDASGDAGGGSVLVGGDYQGKNPAIRNASATWFGPDATIRADALTQGHGGKVIVWSDEATRAHGTITARGGAQGGDGGLVETSGRYLDAAGLRVNASAPHGKAGVWLLDPTDVTICNTCPTTGVTPGPNFITNATGANVLNTDIEAALNFGTSVSVTTSPTAGVPFDAEEAGNIQILANTTITKNDGGDATLLLNAHNFIFAEDGVRISSSSGRLNVDFNSSSDPGGGGPIIVGTDTGTLGVVIQTNGGDVRMFGGGDPVNGRAQGNNAFPVGVQLVRTTIDTIPSAGGAGGSVLVRGQGGAVTFAAGLVAGDGVLLAQNTVITTGSGSLTLDGIAGPGAASPGVGIAGAGVWLDQARLSTDTGTITLTGRGSTPGSLAGPGGDGVRLQPVSAAATNSITTNSGAIVINGTGGAGGPSLTSTAPASAGGSGFSTSNSSLQTGSGNVTITGTGGAGGAGFSNTGGDGTSGGAGGVGVLLGAAAGPVIQTSGAIQITSFGGNGGAGGIGAGNGGAGGDGGAGFNGGGATILSGSALAEIGGSGGNGADGGNCGRAGAFCGSGGSGGAGVLLNGLVQAAGGGVETSGVGGDGAKGGDGLAGSFGGLGGGGGDGISTSNAASIVGTSGLITLNGTAGEAGPGSLAGGAPRTNSEGFSGTGVGLFGSGFAGSPTLGTTSGDIFIFGLSTSPFANRGATGVSLSGVTIATTAGGSIDIRGRGEAPATSSSTGIDIFTSSIIRTQGAPGRIVISGQSTGADFGVVFGEEGGTNLIGGPTTSGNIVIRAANAGGGDSVDLIGNTTIQTTGMINLRPGGVSSSGSLTPVNGETIEIDVAPILTAASFVLSPGELDSLADGAAAIVIGGDTHSGPISVLTPYTFKDNVTLQNAGAGSQGIAINAPLSSPGNLITLSSAGPVTQAATAPITAGSLLLQGTGAGSNFLLTHPGNAVSQFDADSPLGGQVRFENTGVLTIGPLAGTGFDSASNTPTAISAPNTVSFSDLFVRTTGNLSLAHSVSTIGSDIDLVTGGIFNNFGGGALLPGGTGSWQVWARIWVGEDRGGLVPTSPSPNFFGCTYPGTCISGVTIPATGNRFIYEERPSLTLVANDKSRFVGQPNPPFDATVSGLVNGDTQADAVVATLSTPATQISPASTYPINVTGAFSPVGYIVNIVDGRLNVLDLPPLNGLTDTPRLIATEESLLYARNLGTPFMCTPSGPLAVPASAEEGSDNLAREWGRVRIRPNLTNCLGLGERGGCDDF